MDLTNLTKKEYLGTTCINTFRNIETGETKNVEITEAEYKALATAKPEEMPTLDGYVWCDAGAGVIKVDSPNVTLSENEYTEVDGKRYILTMGDRGFLEINVEEI